MAESAAGRRRPSRGARIALWAGGLLVVGLLAVLIAARLYLDEDRSRRMALEIVSDVLAGDFAMARLEWRRFPDVVILHEVVVKTPEGEPVATLGRLRVELALASLLRRRVELEEIEAEDVLVRVLERPGEEGGFTLADAFSPVPSERPEPEKEGPGWRVEVGRLDVRGLDVELRRGDLAVTVQGAKLEGGSLSMDLPRVRTELDGLHVPSISITQAGRTFDFRELRVTGVDYRRTGVPAEAAISWDAASGGTGASTLRLEGSVAGLSEGEPMILELEGEADLDLADPAILQLLPAKLRERLTPRGRVTLSAQAEGRLEAPQVRARLEGSDLEVGGTRLERVEVRAVHGATGLAVESLLIQVPGGRLTGEGRLELAAAPPVYDLALEAESFPIREVASPFVDPKWLPATVQGTIKVAGAGLEAPRAKVEVDLASTGRPSALPDAVPGALAVTGRATVTRSHASLESLRVVGGGARVTASGRVPLGEGPLDVQLEAVHARPGRLFAALDLPMDAARASLTARVQGTYDQPRVEGTARALALRYEDQPPIDVVAPLRFEAGTLHLDQAVARTAGGRAQVTGTLALLSASGEVLAAPQVDARVALTGVQLGRYTGERVKGEVRFEGRVQGPAKAPVGRGVVQVGGMRVEGLAFTEAQAQVVMDGRTLRATELELVPEPGGRILGEVTLELEASTVEGTARGSGLPLGILSELSGSDLQASGVFGFEASVSGPLRTPRYEAKAEVQEVRLRGASLGTLDATAQGDLEQVAVAATLTGEAGTVTVRGAYGLESGRVEGQVHAREVILAALPGLLPEEGGEATLGGTLFAELAIDGALPLPGILGSIRVESPRVTGHTLERPVILEVSPGDQGLVFEAQLAGLGIATGRLRPGPPLTVELVTRVRDLPVHNFVPSLADYDTLVLTSGELHAMWRSGEGVTASVNLDALTVELADGKLSATEPVRARWDGETLFLDALTLRGPQGSFTAAGRAGDTLDLVAQGSLEMGLVAPFVPAIARASGTAQVDVHVTGTAGAPVAQGEISLVTPVNLRPRQMIREIILTQARIRFTPGLVRLERLTGTMESGLFTAEGEIALNGLSPGRYSLELSGQNLPLRTEDMALEANLDVRATGEGADALISGRVDVVRGRYLRKFELRNFNFIAQRKDVDEPLERRYPWLGTLELDLAATSTGGMEVRVDAGALGLELSLDADLRVTGTAADPVIDGRVSSERGHIAFPKAKLDVTRSVIEFTPQAGEGIHPVVDLRAEGEVTPPPSGNEFAPPTYLVTLTLEGDLEELVLDLSSDPPLDRLEILSLLIAGRINPAESGATGGDTSKADAALAFAGSQLAEPLTRFITRGLERSLNLELQLGAEVSTAGITVTAGKELTRRLRLEGAYSRSFGEVQTVGSVRARFLLSDDLFLEGTTETVSGQVASTAAPREGSRTRLELKLRIFGD